MGWRYLLSFNSIFQSKLRHNFSSLLYAFSFRFNAYRKLNYYKWNTKLILWSMEHETSTLHSQKRSCDLSSKLIKFRLFFQHPILWHPKYNFIFNFISAFLIPSFFLSRILRWDTTTAVPSSNFGGETESRDFPFFPSAFHRYRLGGGKDIRNKIKKHEFIVPCFKHSFLASCKQRAWLRHLRLYPYVDERSMKFFFFNGRFS